MRTLILDAKASLEAAPDVIALMAQELGRDQTWEKKQLNGYNELAKAYLV